MEKDSGRNSSGKAESHHTPGGRGTTSGTSGDQGHTPAEGNPPSHSTGDHGHSASEGNPPSHTTGEHGHPASEGSTPIHTTGEHGHPASEGSTPSHTTGEHGHPASEASTPTHITGEHGHPASEASTPSHTTGDHGHADLSGRAGRTRTLEALCILSFVGSSSGLLLWLICGIFFPQAESIFRSLTDLTATQGLTSAYFLIFSLFSAISLSGVILMWRGRMIGFPVYAAAQVMIVSWPMVTLGKSGFSSVSLLFSLLFVILYAHEMVRLYSLEKSRMFSR